MYTVVKLTGREKYLSHYTAHGAYWKAITGTYMNIVIHMFILHMT